MSTDSPSRIIANLQHERDELRAEVERLRDVLSTQDAQHATDRQLLKAELAELAKLREERRKSAAELVSLANEVHSGDPERSGWSARIRTVAHRLWFAPPGEKGE